MGRAIIVNLDFDTPGRPGRSTQAFSTGVFDVITEGARAHFKPGEQACALHCFFRLDEQFQEHISLDELHPAWFNIFVRACETGLAQYRSTGITGWGMQHDPDMVRGIAWEWSELIKKLHADPRYVAGEPGERDC
ncbi:hypothetical protein [Variovorax guangxiensis]|uniref:hypothetical protein n=1 Tax=Variovorax guangxiensis TaxID=1775474 RepID=UPI002855EED2|nr:hypothetical protein [Variovorax guangxiensis]MDR6856819.1 hypothetical protein [Variovorax guangxiensis]